MPSLPSAKEVISLPLSEKLSPTRSAALVWANATKPLPKAEDKNEGPYEVTHVYTNGTVRIQQGTINERLNIRRLTPYFEGSEDANMEA